MPVDIPIAQLEVGVRAHGRATLLVPGLEARDACRRALADAGVGMGVDVTTPAAWLAGLWELFGDGRSLVSALERQLLMAAVLDGCEPAEVLPLRVNPGTVRMLARMAGELLPYAVSAAPCNRSEQVICKLLGEYARMLEERGLIEGAEASELLRARIERTGAPACARCVALYDIDGLPAYLVRLLAATQGGAVLEGPCAAVSAPAVPLKPGSDGKPLRFVEVAGPHAKARAYADEVARLVDAGADEVVAVSARPMPLFAELASRLAACGIAVRVAGFTRFSETVAGQQFTALLDLAARMRAVEEGRAEPSLWWPAPELTDWLYAPLSGMGTAAARQLDKKLRGNRQLTPEAVMRQLQSAQGRANAARAKLDPASARAQVPAVCADVFASIRQERYVSALKAMLAVAETLPASAFGTVDGSARAQAEQAMLRRAIEVLAETARELGVSQAVALTVLDGLAVSSRMESQVPDARATLRIVLPGDAAYRDPASVDAVLCTDMDIESYPLAREEGPLTSLAEVFGAHPLAVEPIVRLRRTFARILAVSKGEVVLARVTHDRQAKDRYPAAIWTELKAAAGEGCAVVSVGEGGIVADFDPAAAVGLRTERVACLSPQELSPEAAGYLLLRRENPERPGELVPRLLSASQIESYLTCPLCWFMSNRVRPQRLDAGFGNMEKGNFVHDVLYRFHQELIEQGVSRVTSGNLEDCAVRLRAVFARVRDEHARGKTDSSAPLVPLSAGERVEVEQILPQLERALRYEAEALAPFSPLYLEYSFNSLGVEYAGRPLGGRIDRVDVDVEGRAVVIDYKHRANADQFKAADPTVPLKKTGEVPADDPDWLPAHTQALIYAQALRRAGLGLDPRGALYFSTKGAQPAMRGAVASELVEQEPHDGHVPGLKAGFPDEDAGGTCTFEQLLDRVEETVRRRLDELEAGCVRAAEEEKAYCAQSHGLGFECRAVDPSSDGTLDGAAGGLTAQDTDGAKGDA